MRVIGHCVNKCLANSVALWHSEQDESPISNLEEMTARVGRMFQAIFQIRILSLSFIFNRHNLIHSDF